MRIFIYLMLLIINLVCGYFIVQVFAGRSQEFSEFSERDVNNLEYVLEANSFNYNLSGRLLTISNKNGTLALSLSGMSDELLQNFITPWIKLPEGKILPPKSCRGLLIKFSIHKDFKYNSFDKDNNYLFIDTSEGKKVQYLIQEVQCTESYNFVQSENLIKIQ